MKSLWQAGKASRRIREGPIRELSWAEPRSSPCLVLSAGAKVVPRGDVLLGIDAGTSVIKAVAFGVRGEQIAASSVANRYVSGPDGSAVQDMDETWKRC